MGQMLERIEEYWTNRAEGYSQVNQEELATDQKNRWLRALEAEFPHRAPKNIKVLDIGTGPGFFAIILARAGYQVTAVDYTEEMLCKAKENAGRFADRIHWMRMDAQKLELPDNQFDVAVSRNLTWNLENPDEAYKEWKRVLKPGGVLLNFDGDYGKEEFTEEMESLPADHAHRQLSCGQLKECDKIKDQLPISAMRRPAWDVEVLKNLGCVDVTVDSEVYRRVYASEDSPFYNPTPIFRLQARKTGKR